MCVDVSYSHHNEEGHVNLQGDKGTEGCRDGTHVTRRVQESGGGSRGRARVVERGT